MKRRASKSLDTLFADLEVLMLRRNHLALEIDSVKARIVKHPTTLVRQARDDTAQLKRRVPLLLHAAFFTEPPAECGKLVHLTWRLSKEDDGNGDGDRVWIWQCRARFAAPGHSGSCSGLVDELGDDDEMGLVTPDAVAVPVALDAGLWDVWRACVAAHPTNYGAALCALVLLAARRMYPTRDMLNATNLLCCAFE